MNTNKSAGTKFRDEVILALHEHGFVGTRRAPESARGPWSNGNIHGLSSVTLRAHNERDIALSSQIDQVEAEARLAGNRMFFSVQSRRGHDVREAYAITTLDVLIDLLRQLYPEEAAMQNLIPA